MRSFFSRYKGVIFGVVIVSLLILAVLTKIGFNSTKNFPTPTPTPKPIDLCAPFTTNPGEISCEEAKNIILTKYPGQIINISKNTIEYNVNKSQKTEQRKVWLVKIKPNNPSLIPAPLINPTNKEVKAIDAIEIALDINTGDILSIQLNPK